MEPSVSRIVSTAMFPNQPRYSISEGIPEFCQDCQRGAHHWLIVRVGDIMWWSCERCSETWCTQPGLDKCDITGLEVSGLTYESLDALSMGERLQALVASPKVACHRLTTARCPHCELAYCSDHLPAHLGWCGPNGDTIPDDGSV